MLWLHFVITFCTVQKDSFNPLGDFKAFFVLFKYEGCLTMNASCSQVSIERHLHHKKSKKKKTTCVKKTTKKTWLNQQTVYGWKTKLVNMSNGGRSTRVLLISKVKVATPL